MKAYLVILAALSLSSPVYAEEHDDEPSAAEHEEGAPEHEGEHGHAAHGHDEHGPPGDINWAYGFVGEKDGVEPSLLFRPKGMPPPFLANLINAAILFGVIIGAGRKPIAQALRKRKERIVAGMEEAARMKEEAARRLAEYEEKLEKLDGEIERVRREMREAAESDRRRILAETKERQERMQRDAQLLVEQEIKAARETLMAETVASAIRSAQELLTQQLGSADQERMARDYLETIREGQRPIGGAS